MGGEKKERGEEGKLRGKSRKKKLGREGSGTKGKGE